MKPCNIGLNLNVFFFKYSLNTSIYTCPLSQKACMVAPNRVPWLRLNVMWGWGSGGPQSFPVKSNENSSPHRRHLSTAAPGMCRENATRNNKGLTLAGQIWWCPFSIFTCCNASATFPDKTTDTYQTELNTFSVLIHQHRFFR